MISRTRWLEDGGRLSFREPFGHSATAHGHGVPAAGQISRLAFEQHRIQRLACRLTGAPKPPQPPTYGRGMTKLPRKSCHGRPKRLFCSKPPPLRAWPSDGGGKCPQARARSAVPKTDSRRVYDPKGSKGSVASLTPRSYCLSSHPHLAFFTLWCLVWLQIHHFEPMAHD